MSSNVDGHFGNCIFYLNFYTKGSIGNHQFNKDWNEILLPILLACASRINPYFVRTVQKQLLYPRNEFLCSKKIILSSEEHS